MSTLSPRPTLIPSLNALLNALALPFTLDDPTDLTPSLLLAIFESLISARLPIPPSVRQSRTRDAKSRAMLVLLGVLECDVLRGGTAAADTGAEHSVSTSNVDDSVLGGPGGVSVDGWVDEIGLGEVDPERLADGGWEETIFVGELLCWLARRKGILPRTRSSHRPSHPRSLYSNHHSYGTEEGEGDTADFSTSLLLRPSPVQKSRSPRPPSPSTFIEDPYSGADFSALSHITDVPRHPLVHSPEPSLSASATTGTDLSIRARSVSSRTSVHDDQDDFDEVSQDTVQMYDSRQMIQDAEDDDDPPPTFRPRCIHELDDPSYIQALAGSSSSFDPSVSHEHIAEGEADPSRDEDDDNADEQDNDYPCAPPTPTPRRVRLTGWIDTVDAATELSHFAASHSHSRSRALHTGTSSRPGSSSRSHKHTHTDEFPKSISRPTTEAPPRSHPGSDKFRTPHRAPPPSSPSPSPIPSPPPPTSLKHPPPRWPSSPPPSPPSPTTHSDPPFDISFSTLNNTSTPAKSRPPRRPQSQTTTRHEIVTATQVGVHRSRSGGSMATAAAAGRPRLRRRDRSPSYTPSPPSFSTPGSLRSGGGSSGSSGATTRLSTSAPHTAPASSSTAARTKKRGTSPPLPLSSTTGKSPPTVTSAGSTATTNSLLTERARLLTELAALKRARAVNGAGGAGGVVSHRVGVGV